MTIERLPAPTENSQPSLSVIAIAVFVAIGLGLTVFSYGRSAHEAAERSNALVVASENQAFCEELGIAAQSENYRKCLSGLDAIRLRQEQRRQAEAADLL